MDSTINLAIRITHSRNLPTDAQGVADLAGRLLTEALQDDPQLLATATVQSAFLQTMFEDNPNADPAITARNRARLLDAFYRTHDTTKEA